MKPVQFPVDAQDGLIKVHHFCMDQFLPDLLHNIFDSLPTPPIYTGQRANAEGNGEQIREGLCGSKKDKTGIHRMTHIVIRPGGYHRLPSVFLCADHRRKVRVLPKSPVK